MSFQAPIFALLFALPLALLALEAYGARRRRAALARFLGEAADSAPARPRRPRRWRIALTLLAVALAVAALARPQWGTETRSARRDGRDVAILLDVSRSMLARDVRPSRLERARAAVAELVGSIDPGSGHRFKLVAFAGRAAVLCPYTDDPALFLERLAAAGPEAAARRGTRIGSALSQALRDVDAGEGAFVDAILLSDGEDHGGDMAAAARDAAARDVTVHTVGIGDPVEGAPVPGLSEDGGEAGPLLYDGRAVRSVLDPEPLRLLAEGAGGTYTEAGAGPIDLRPLFDGHVASKPKRPREGAREEVPVERFQWFVALSILAWGGALAARRVEDGRA